ncbi:MAG TPA: choice-of-anchor tandem repeat GloVer-containing protein [Candidatus Dormibacteraeota bacterium]|nr:choice-of-anchor tandem repeat GloVer-containing protein [Candidatus Dormibacteraeota bacterium]
MGHRRIPPFASRILIFAASVFLVTAAWAASTTKLIYSFAGSTDGEYTDTELVRDSAGNLYGTSVQGGTGGGGTVFQVTPAGVHTVLYNFTGGADGGEPYKGVTLDAQGNLYGTAVTGGGGSCEGGCGVVFKLANSGGVWTQSVIHTFTGGSDGFGPGAPVSIDTHGNIYGTTPTGGAYGVGTVYQLHESAGIWKIRVIHTFTGGADGGGGSAERLLIDSAGNLFGVCTFGGVNGFGTVYEISLHQAQWRLTTLYAFKDQPDGASPYGGVVFDKQGNLYGTTYYAGANDFGTVYKLTPSNGTWTESVLYSFKGGTDGASPISSLVADAAGNFYGTTSAGGASCSCGVIFKMTHGSSGKWTESVAYSFTGAPNPGFAYNGMITGAGGVFYGATVHGGSNDDGTVYEFIP